MLKVAAWLNKIKKNFNWSVRTRQGWLAMLAYALFLGAVTAMATWLMDKGELSSRFAIPLMITYAILSTILLYKIVFSDNSRFVPKKQSIKNPPPFNR